MFWQITEASEILDIAFNQLQKTQDFMVRKLQICGKSVEFIKFSTVSYE